MGVSGIVYKYFRTTMYKDFSTLYILVIFVYKNISTMIDILKSHKKYFNIRAIEEECGIPKSVLSGYLLGRRKSLSEEHIKSLGIFWDGLHSDKIREVPVKKKTSVVSKPKEKKVVKKQTDEKWDLASNYKSSVAGYKVVNGHAQKPVIRDGKLMVRL